MIPQPEEIWQHYKTTGEYKILGLGKLQIKDPSLDMCDCVIYSAVSDGKVWIRPLTDFMESVTNEKGEDVPRFQKIR